MWLSGAVKVIPETDTRNLHVDRPSDQSHCKYVIWLLVVYPETTLSGVWAIGVTTIIEQTLQFVWLLRNIKNPRVKKVKTTRGVCQAWKEFLVPSFAVTICGFHLVISRILFGRKLDTDFFKG